MVSVKVGDPDVCRGLLREAMRFGCQLFGSETICLLGKVYTPIAGLWGKFLIRSGGGEVVTELVSNSLGVFLWRIKYFFSQRSLCIVMNSHSMLTSPRENCLDCIRTIQSINPFVDSVIHFLASLEYSRSARMIYLSALKSGHVSEKQHTTGCHNVLAST